MQYSIYGGVQATPLESIRSFASNFHGRNWLPIGVASVMMLWISLLFVNIMQQFPADHGAPTKRGSTGQSIAVQSASSRSNGTNGSMIVTQSNGLAVTSDGQSIANVQPAASRTTAATVAAATDDSDQTLNPIIGGKGGDGGVTDPVVDTPTVTTTPADTTVTTPVGTVDVQPPSTGSGGTGNTGVGVDTPVIDANLNVNPSSGSLSAGAGVTLPTLPNLL